MRDFIVRAYLAVVVVIALLLAAYAGAAADRYMAGRRCPTEDSCLPAYVDGRWQGQPTIP